MIFIANNEILNALLKLVAIFWCHGRYSSDTYKIFSKLYYPQAF